MSSLRYSIEQWSDVAVEIQPLLKRHWEEVGMDREQVPLDVNCLRYTELSQDGKLIIITARDPEDDHRLVGYLGALISPHLHYEGTLFGLIDVFWIEPKHRRGTNGVKLFTVLEAELKRRGVRKVIGQTKVREDLDVSALYEYLGWTRTEVLFTKVL